MKKILISLVGALLVGTLFIGCEAISTPAKKIDDVKQQGQSITAKINQQIVSKVIASSMIETGHMANKEEIEKILSKSLKDMNISVKTNSDGSIKIINTDPNFTKSEVPDITLTKDELGL